MRLLLFAPTVGFGLATLGLLVVPSTAGAGFGTGLGTVVSVPAALGLSSKSTTRYARAVVTDEPVVAFPWIRPNRDLRWIGGGLGCLALAVAFAGMGHQFPIRSGSVGLVFMGAWALFVGLSFRYGTVLVGTNADVDSSSSRWPRRSILGSTWTQETDPDTSGFPELHVHRAGLVVVRPIGRTLVPWGAVSTVRLTADELVVERDGRLDIRCERTMIDDPAAAYGMVQRIRSGGRAAP